MRTAASMVSAIDDAVARLTAGESSVSVSDGQTSKSYTRTDMSQLIAARNYYAQLAAREKGDGGFRWGTTKWV